MQAFVYYVKPGLCLIITLVDSLLLQPARAASRLNNRNIINRASHVSLGKSLVLLIDGAANLLDLFKEYVQCLLDADVKDAMLSMLPSKRYF